MDCGEPFDFEAVKRELDNKLDEMIGNSIRSTNRFRWFVLSANLLCAGLYLIPPYKVSDWIFMPFHIGIGVGVFVFMTKQRNKLLRDHTLRKLSRGGKTRWDD